MHLWQQGSILTRLHTLTRRNKTGKNKLKRIKEAKPPTDIKMIHSFVCLCNFFQMHIKDFTLIATPLFRLTKKDSRYKSGPSGGCSECLSHSTKTTNLRTSDGFSPIGQAICFNHRCSNRDLRNPRRTWSNPNTSYQRRKIFMQSHLYHDHEKNYSLFLLEAAAAMWGIDNFNEYLQDKQFILYTDHKLLEKLGHLHNKALIQLLSATQEQNFIIQYKKGPTCWQITFHILQLKKQVTQLHSSQLSSHFKAISENSSWRTQP